MSSAVAQSPNPFLNVLRRPLVQYLLLYLVVMCVYVPTFWFSYVWDDITVIRLNDSIRDWDNLSRFFTDPATFAYDPENKIRDEWRPLRNVYYLLTYKLHEYDSAGWHLQHVLLHSMVSAMLLALFHRLYRYARALRPTELLPVNVQLATWFAVLAWAVHPVNTEVTAWLKSADDLLACLLTLASLLILFPTHAPLTYLRAFAGGLLFFLAFLAKESIAPIPMIYFVVTVTLAPSRTQLLKHKPFWLATLLLFAGLISYVMLRQQMLGQLEQVPYLAGSFSLMMATMATAFARYLQLVVWPFWPTVQIGDYDGWPRAQSWREISVLVSLLILAIAIISATIVARRSKIFTAGLIFGILAFTPVANIVPMMQVMAERFVYFPLMGFSLSLAALYAWLLRVNIARRMWVPVILSVALGATTLYRMPAWQDHDAFVKTVKANAPESSRPNYNYALSLYREGRTTESMNLLFKVMQDYPDENTLMLISLILVKNDHKTSAVEFLDFVSKRFPESPRPYALRGDIARFERDPQTAVDYYTSASKRDPSNANLRYLMAQMYRDLGTTPAAARAAADALRLEPENTSASQLLRELQQ